MLGLDVGEKVLWKHHSSRKMEKISARWSYGMFLGVRAKSGELIVADCELKEVKYVRTAKRILEEQRWDAKNLEWIPVVPWNRGARIRCEEGP